MHECPDQVEIDALHDRELTSARAEAIERHLLTCSACAAHLSSLQVTSRAVGAMDRPALSTDAIVQLHGQFDASRALSLVRFAQVISGLAAVILFATIASIAMSGAGMAPSSQPAESTDSSDASVMLAMNDQSIPQSIQTAQWMVSNLSNGK